MKSPVLWLILILAGLVALLEALCLTGVINKLTMQRRTGWSPISTLCWP